MVERVGSCCGFIDIGQTIAIVVQISVVAQSIAIGVSVFCGIVGEGIDIVQSAISITVGIHPVANTVAIGIGRRYRRIEPLAVTSILSYVSPSITIVIFVGIVADSVTICVEPF